MQAMQHAFTNLIYIFLFLVSLSLTASFKNSLETRIKLRIKCPKIVCGSGVTEGGGRRDIWGGRAPWLLGGYTPPVYNVAKMTYSHYVVHSSILQRCQCLDAFLWWQNITFSLSPVDFTHFSEHCGVKTELPKVQNASMHFYHSTNNTYLLTLLNSEILPCWTEIESTNSNSSRSSTCVVCLFVCGRRMQGSCCMARFLLFVPLLSR